MKDTLSRVALILLASVPTSVWAVKLDNPLRVNSIQDLLAAILNIVVIFATPLVIFFIIYAGFQYVTAQGNPEKISTAHRALLYAVIGGVIVLGANLLIEVITSTVQELQNETNSTTI